MNSKEIQRLLHRDCKNSSGGITSLAYTLEKSPNILSNKLNVDCEQNQLSFIEAIELIATVQSKKTLSAIAAQIDHIVVPMPRCADCGQDVLSRFLDIAESSGRIGKEIKSAVSSNSELGRDLSQNEKEKILAEVNQLIEQAICLKMELGQ
ncbi:phage regulatory CII family protein [Pasteurella multocida]|uniref:phage regulatory CII family protein n=1 Tax=Pasteurella multocida TaxID=747 RepID=UPI002BC9CF2F|nr:phage regulatory CII family protein [Pasteurella multocida]MEB3492838.1 phage regulatory CII family protein [Pasteurella multocida]